MPAWTGSPAVADYRGFTHRRLNYRGFTHRPESAGGPPHAPAEADQAVRLWITDPESRFSGSAESGFHPPLLRGITHRTIGVSHTESRGFTHRALRQHADYKAKIPLCEQLNLLNDSYLTESLNRRRAKFDAFPIDATAHRLQRISCIEGRGRMRENVESA